MNLNEILKTKVKDWRESDYKSDCLVIREIFEYNFLIYIKNTFREKIF